VAARDLLAGQIEDVTKQAADWRAEHMQDIQRPHRLIPRRLCE